MVCLRYAKDKMTAQDYLQEAFISIFKKLNYFDPAKGVFESWAKRITINACLMHIRQQSLYTISMQGEIDVESNDANALSDLGLQEMLRMVQQLPQGYKTIFNMYVIDGYSHKEIASELNISINTSKTQLKKARTALQKKILDNQQSYRMTHG